MDKLMEFLPFLIPLILAELAVLGYTLFHIFTHSAYKRGSRALWVVLAIVLMNTFIGPILYFLFGKEDS
ncbi:MAG: PLDc N-terminal domain-containing protein [Clostridia bacterium]|nr:PLDc N-terminal domain-containing protein [Clostridia bacterium]